MTTAVVVPATVRGEAPAPSQPLKRGDACTVVIFGASGDLAKRKLFPALPRMAEPIQTASSSTTGGSCVGPPMSHAPSVGLSSSQPWIVSGEPKR